MVSLPPGRCCFTGFLHEGNASGEMTEFNNTRTYVSYPPDKSTHTAILFLADGHGIDFINSQLIADAFAAQGYLVVMPDLLHGDSHPLNGSDFPMEPWLARNPPSRVDPVVESTLATMRNTLGCVNIAAVGYCFGAKYLVRYLRNGQLKAGYVAHPSFVTREELAGIQGPLSIAAAEDDYIFTVEKRHETEEVLAKALAAPVPWQICLYSGVEHSFSVKADLSIRQKKWAKEQAFMQAVRWFDEHVKLSS